MLASTSVRLAMPQDARDIARFSRDFIEHGLGWTYTEAKIIRAIQSATTNVAVIDDRGILPAFGIMDYGMTTAHLVLLGVQPAMRRRGLGGQVLCWLEQCAVTAGIERIRLEARADNPQAISFYQKQGYRVRDRIPGYYRGILDAVCLEKAAGDSGSQPGS